MRNYEKPTIILTDDLAEGIYASSGSIGDGDNDNGNGNDGETGKKCKSLYMGGVYVQGTHQPIRDGYKVGKGCEGCPASWGYCAVKSVNYDGDFRPSWEKNGKLPDEKGY